MKSLHITTLLPKCKKLIAKVPHYRIVLPVSGALMLVGVAVLLQTALSCDCKDHTGAEAHKEQLHGQVTTQDGAPRDGRDPSTQQQNSLASAASKPSGVGQRVDKPATGMTGSRDHHDGHHAAANDSKKTGIGTNGCYVDYGIQGEQCLPAHAAMGGQLSCDGVRSHGFPNGIKITGTDRFHLDTNHDDIACNSGD